MTPDLERRVAERVAAVLQVDVAEIGLEDDLETDWGVDSLLFLEVVDELEALAGQPFDDSVFKGCVSVRDLARAMEVDGSA